MYSKYNGKFSNAHLESMLICGVEYLVDVLPLLPQDSDLRHHIEGYLEDMTLEEGVEEARFWPDFSTEDARND